MTAQVLDHVNLQTMRLAEMTAFYRDIIGLEDGDRPPFSFGGAWLWCGGRAAVHLVEIEQPIDPRDPKIEHFAFRCEGLKQFTERCRDHRVPYYVRVVPLLNIRQVNVFDPDGNKVEMQFADSDDPDTDLSPFMMQAPS
ncbi:MAG: VOC family protein [Alphaproteobacteria bacterium]